MNIQLALDRMTIRQAITVTEKVRPFVDWIEVGTSLIKEFGMDSVRELRHSFPDKQIVADMKTYDNAKYEFELCYNAGADVATVMGTAPRVTIEACINIAVKHGKQVMIDLLNASEEQLRQLSEYKETIFCSHVSKDEQEQRKPIEHKVSYNSLHLPNYLMNKPYRYALAGGITVDALQTLTLGHQAKPYVVIVGSSITQSDAPMETAQALYNLVQTWKMGD